MYLRDAEMENSLFCCVFIAPRTKDARNNVSDVDKMYYTISRSFDIKRRPEEMFASGHFLCFRDVLPSFASILSFARGIKIKRSHCVSCTSFKLYLRSLAEAVHLERAMHSSNLGKFARGNNRVSIDHFAKVRHKNFMSLCLLLDG